MKVVTDIHTGRQYRRISRWITLKHNYHPTKRNKLWDYACDKNGYHPYQDKFDPANGLYLPYFRYKGQTYALKQFYILGGIWTGGQPIMYNDSDGKLAVIGTIDMDGPIFGPGLYGEWDEYCEAVRLYEDVI